MRATPLSHGGAIIVRPLTARRDASHALLDARPVEALDLHGYTLAEAVRTAKNFVVTWQRRAPGAVVRIITGKGKGSANGPVLRERVRRLLKSELRGLVAESTLALDEGGFLVRLK